MTPQAPLRALALVVALVASFAAWGGWAHAAAPAAAVNRAPPRAGPAEPSRLAQLGEAAELPPAPAEGGPDLPIPPGAAEATPAAEVGQAGGAIPPGAAEATPAEASEQTLATPSAALPAAGVAAMTPWLGQPVAGARVVFEGPYETRHAERLLEFKAGEPLTPFLLERNILLLYQLGNIADVEVDATREADGMVLIFHAFPLPMVDEVQIQRPLRLVESLRFDRALCLVNRGPSELELQRLVSLRAGHAFRPEDLDRLDGPIKTAYVEAGFGENQDDVLVTVRQEPVEKGRVRIVIEIDAVCPRIVSRVRFKGVPAAEARALEDLVRLRVGDYYDPAEAENDRRRILDYYQASHPYRWCRGRPDGVVDPDLALPYLARLARRDCDPLLKGNVGFGDDRLAAEVQLKAQRAANNTVALIYEVDKGPRIFVDFFVIGAPSFGPLRGFTYRKIVGFLGTDRRRLLGSTREELMGLLDMETERRFSTGFLEEAQGTLEEHYRRAGYNEVRVRVRNASEAGEEALRLVVTIRLGDVLPVHEITVEGNEHLDDATFAGIFKESLAENAPWGVFTDESFERAPGIMLDYYRSQGFKAAYFDAVDHHLEEGPLGPRVVITCTVVEGPRTVVQAIDLQGVESIDPALVAAQVRLKVGEPYNPNQARDTARAIAGLYRSQGYLDVRVTGGILEEEGTAQRVSFEVREGQQHHFGLTLVQGNRKTRDVVIDRELTFTPGEVYDLDEISRVQQRLMATGVFRGVEMRTLSGTDTTDDILVSVYERSRIEATASLGISVDDWLEIGLTLSHSNVFGLGHRASLNAELAGMSRSLGFQDLLSAQQFAARVAASTGSKVQFNYLQPRLFGSGLRSSYSVSLFERDFKTNYRIVRNAVSWSLAQQVTPTVQVYSLLQAEQRAPVDDSSLRTAELWNIWEVDRQDRYGASGGLGFVYTTRFGGTSGAASRGFLLAGQAEMVQLYALGSEVDGLRLAPVGDAAERFARISGRATWAEPWFTWLRTEVRLNGGYAHPFAGSDGAIPVEKRFYLGGATNMRGFMLDQLGPVIVDEAAFTGLTGVFTAIPTGGNAFASYTLELIFPMGSASPSLEGWELGVFHDGGNVYWTGESRRTFLDATAAVYDTFSQSDAGPIPSRPSDRCDPIGPVLRKSYGAGLHYQTPVGPLRLDLARNADPRCSEPGWQLHFSIGLF